MGWLKEQEEKAFFGGKRDGGTLKHGNRTGRGASCWGVYLSVALAQRRWSVEVKRGDRVERTGADCTDGQRKGEHWPRGQANAIVL